MPQILEIQEFIQYANEIPIIDVRSPGEYEKGHIPGALNIPLFDDEERANVGTIYRKRGRQEAILSGLSIVGPKLRGLVEKAIKNAVHSRLQVHCWRGGMRSASMAWLFETAGMQCSILNGGYKSYRKYIRKLFSENRKLVILGGLTGTGKSDILRDLEKHGEQFLDLEKIAHHKGSAFGGLGQDGQPTNEQFENNIAREWIKFDPHRPIWIEDESQAIGSVWIPDPLFHRMRSSPVIRINIDKQYRVSRLVKEYADFDKVQLEKIIYKIGKRLGGQHVKSAIEALRKDDFKTVANIVLNYYDKTYEFGISRRVTDTVHLLNVNATSKEEIREKVMNLANQLLK